MAKSGHQLSQRSGKSTVKNEGADGPMPQHKRLAMGQDCDGKTNPYGSESTGKSTIQGKKY